MAGDRQGRRRVAGRRGERVRRLSAVRARGAALSGIDGRIRLLRILVLVFLVLVGGRAVALAASSDLGELARRQQIGDVALPAHRGAILDRHGKELAVGTPQQTVYAAPRLLDDPLDAAAKLCKALRITKKKDQRALAVALSDRTSTFVFIARKADPELAAAALALKLPGVAAYMEEERSYPMQGSAAQVIGFAGVDNKGLEGIEYQFDEELSGRAGSQVFARDPAGRVLRTIRQTEPVPGADVQLTIDADIQYEAEHILSRTVRQSGAASAVAIVMDPRTGQIYALVNAPLVKGHDFGRPKANTRNRAVADVYEPGSIFKMITVAGALADGLVKPTSKFTLRSSIRVADRIVNESHERGTVTYTVAEILQHSSNVGAATIGIKMGKQNLYKWVKAFGFGEQTGIELPGEEKGLVPAPEEWSDSSIGNIPMGQGIAVTPLQMAAAVCAIANDGVAVSPRIVQRVGDTVVPEAEGRQVIPARIARQVRKMLTLVVEKGTGTKGRIKGYKVAGKTGTSQKVGDSGYSKTDYIGSFAAMAPADQPELVVLVAVDTPRIGSYYGGDVAAPAVQQIMSYALQHLEIAP